MGNGKHVLWAAVSGLALLAADVVAASPTVAVFDFEVGRTDAVELQVSTSDGTRENARLERSVQTNLLTDKLVAELVGSGEVSVIERSQLNRLMEETRLSESELTDPDHAVEMGRLLGADYMAFGSITLMEPSVERTRLPYDAGVKRTIAMDVGATIRLVNAETGEVEVAAERQVRTSESETARDGSALRGGVPRSFQDTAHTRLGQALAGEVMDALSPIQVAQESGDVIYLTRGNMSPGTRCEVIERGDAITHPETGEVIGQAERRIAVIEITDGMDGMSTGRVSEWHDGDSVPHGAHCRLLPQEQG